MCLENTSTFENAVLIDISGVIERVFSEFYFVKSTRAN